MALNFIGLSAFTNASLNPVINGITYMPAITGRDCHPEDMIDKTVVRIPPSYGSGAYYVQKRWLKTGLYHDIRWGNGSVHYSDCMDVTWDENWSTNHTRRHVYCNGKMIEGYYFNWYSQIIYYWSMEYLSRSTDSRGRVSFTYKYLYTSLRCTDLGGIDAALDRLRALPVKEGTTRTNTATSESQHAVDPAETFEWLDDFLWYDLTQVLPTPLNRLAATAYGELGNNLPVAQTNSVANVLQAAELVRNIKDKRFLSKNPKDIWLAYRYSYRTSISDIEGYVDLTKRLLELPKASTAKAYSSISYRDTTCRCTATFSTEDIIPRNVSEWLDTYGLRLSAADIWDMLPYSFVVDWFLHISDYIESYENAARSLRLTPTEVWVSFAKAGDDSSTYFRVEYDPRWAPPIVGATINPVSGKTLLYRAADSWALFMP